MLARLVLFLALTFLSKTTNYNEELARAEMIGKSSIKPYSDCIIIIIISCN